MPLNTSKQEVNMQLVRKQENYDDPLLQQGTQQLVFPFLHILEKKTVGALNN